MEQARHRLPASPDFHRWLFAAILGEPLEGPNQPFPCKNSTYYHHLTFTQEQIMSAHAFILNLERIAFVYG